MKAALRDEIKKAGLEPPDRIIFDGSNGHRRDLHTAKQRINIVDLFEAAGCLLKKSGKNFVCICPLPGHVEKTPSNFVFPDRGRFQCFGCGAHGDAIDFVQKLHGLSFPDALRFLGIDQGRMTPKVQSDIHRRRQRQELLQRFRQWENQKADELGLLIRTTRRLLATIKTMQDLERLGDLFHGIDGLEHDFEILCTSDKETIFNYFKEGIVKWALA